MKRYTAGDPVWASRRIEGIDVPEVPAGARGEVVATMLWGRPARVHFDLMTVWGPKSFDVPVGRRDVHGAHEHSDVHGAHEHSDVHGAHEHSDVRGAHEHGDVHGAHEHGAHRPCADASG